MSLPPWRLPASVTERAKAWGPRLLDGLYWILLGAAPVVLFLIFFDPHVLDPTRIGWTMEADWGQHVLGWNAWRHMPWSSGNHENLLYAPYGLNIIYTDSNPLFAFIFKPFRAWLPQNFQYIGMWFLFCVCMHFIFAYKLVKPHAPGKWATLGGAIALSALPCLYYRERHDTLMAQWLILWALHLFINVEAGPPRPAPEGARPWRILLQRIANIFDAKTRGYMALLGVTGLIHPYLLFMVAAIWSGDVLRGLWAGVSVRNLHLTAKALVRVFVVLICPIVTLGISGCYAAGQSPNAGGWAYYSMALDALINPVRPEFSQIIKAVPLDGGQSFEGYQYLGFGLLMLLVAAAIIYAVTPEARRAKAFFGKLKFLALPFLALFLTAITNRVQLYGHTLFFFQMPDQMKNTLAILRASGRFFWPMSYCMVLAALVVLYKSRPRIMAAVLPLVLLLQAYDLDGFAATVRAATSLASNPQTYYLTTSPKWDKLIAESKGVDFYPANVHFNDKLFYELTWRATSHALPVNTMYPARENILQLAKEEEGQQDFRHGQIHNDHLFVFLKQCDAPKALQDKLRMLGRRLGHPARPGKGRRTRQAGVDADPLRRALRLARPGHLHARRQLVKARYRRHVERRSQGRRVDPDQARPVRRSQPQEGQSRPARPKPQAGHRRGAGQWRQGVRAQTRPRQAELLHPPARQRAAQGRDGRALRDPGCDAAGRAGHHSQRRA